MIVSHSKKLVYLSPPKTGTMSIKLRLEKEPFNAVVIGGHAHHDATWLPELKDYFYFITVRHPYTRMYSLWRMVVNQRTSFCRLPPSAKIGKEHPGRTWHRWYPGGNPTFDEFLWQRVRGPKLPTFRNHWRCSWNLEQLPDDHPVTVVRMESYREGLKGVPALAPYLESIGHVNKNQDGGKMPWVDAVTPERAERIRELWAEDFDRFGYNRKLENVPQEG